MGLFEVVVVVARVGGELSRVDVKDRAGDGADEVHVVADEDERALVLLERVDQRVDAGHVEVRGRLVQKQQVRRLEEELHERETAFLTAAQHSDALEDIVAAEEKGAEDGAGACSPMFSASATASSSTVRSHRGSPSDAARNSRW